MSLRRDIHSAFESITPPLGGMPERVVQTVLAENRGQRRKEGMLLRARVPLSLVAVIAIVALVAAVLVGGRLIQMWNSHSTSPAGQTYESQLAQLEDLPLRLPTLASHANCKSGPFNIHGDLGTGPVYGVGGGISTTSWGLYYHNFAYSDTKITGPVLIRASDLFRQQPVLFVGQFAAGPVVGHDTVDGVIVDQHLEVVFDTSEVSKTPSTHKFRWDFTAAVPNSWSGSTGWQIDGVGFSEVFLAC